MICLVFTYIFAAEAFLKILALGFITYLQDPWNTFDFVIVIISISDVFISLTSSSDEAQNSGLNVLRTLRFKVKNKYVAKYDDGMCIKGVLKKETLYILEVIYNPFKGSH